MTGFILRKLYMVQYTQLNIKVNIKGLSTNNTTLVESNKIARKEKKLANIMNYYFTNITAHLKTKPTKIDPKANLES